MRDGSGGLPRRLGVWAATALVVSTVIGSGIFRVPAAIARDAGSVGGMLAVWTLGGVIMLCGALSIAELAAAYPRAGGVFVYLREVYGPGTAFLFGWTMLILGQAGMGGIALVFAEYLGTLVPLSPTGVRAVAGAAIVVVAAAAYRSTRGASALAGAATLGKVIALVALVVMAFLLGDGEAGSFGRGAPPAGSTRWGALGLGVVSALWAYNGVQDMVSLAGEVRDPGRTLPRALLAGSGIVVAVYLAANTAYLYVLPFAALQGSPLVAGDVATRLLGAAGVAAVAAMVMVSTFGALAGLSLANPRLFYAMAREGLLFRPLGRVHPRFDTPHVAVVLSAGLSLGFVWLRDFEQLAEAFVLGIWPFLALAVAGVFVLRRRRPDLARPYRVPGYPVVPLVFIVGTLWVLGSALVLHPVSTLGGIGLTLLGVPLYLLWRRAAPTAARSGARSTPPSPDPS
jgi:amino acid transporter